MSIKKNTIWNLAGAGVPLLFAAFCIPYVLGKIGVERFGVLTIVWVLIGYFSLFDFGLGRALTQRISKALAKRDHQTVPNIIFNGVFFTLLTGVFGGLVLAVVAKPLAYEWLNISNNLQEDALKAFLWSTLGIIFTTVSNGFRGVLEAYEDFRNVNIIKIAMGIANFVAPVLSVFFLGDDVSTMVAALVLFRFLLMFYYFEKVNKNVKFKWSDQRIDFSSIKDMLSFGVWMTVSNIISPIMVSFDRFFISNILGGGVVAFYTVPFEMVIRILIIPHALTTTLFPRFSLYLNENDGCNEIMLRKIYFSSLKLIALILGVICFLGSFLSGFLLEFWMGQDFYENSNIVCIILFIGIFFNGLAMMPYSLIQANGDAKITGVIHTLELFFYIPFLIYMIHEFSLNGAAVAWTSRVFLDFLVMNYFSMKIISRKTNEY